jgi:hypothetical protein
MARWHLKVIFRGGDFPTGFVSTNPADFDNWYLMPMLIHYIPNNETFNPRKGRKYVLDRDPVEIKGRNCYRYGPSVDPGEPLYSYWLDLEGGANCCQIEKTWRGKLLWRIVIEHEQDSEFYYYPSKIDYQEFLGADLLSHSQGIVQSIKVNEPIDKSQFVLDFPIDTYVNDRTSDRDNSYIVRGGGNRKVSRSERVSGLNYQRYISTDPDEGLSIPRWLLLICVVLLCMLGIFFWRKR